MGDPWRFRQAKRRARQRRHKHQPMAGGIGRHLPWWLLLPVVAFILLAVVAAVTP